MKMRQLLIILALLTGTAFLAALYLYGRSTTALAEGTDLVVSGSAVVQASSATWITEHVDAPKSFEDMTDRSLALDSQDRPHIAYGEDHLYYAWHDGASWYTETVDSNWRVGGYASIQVDSNDYPHISYYDASNGTLKYAYWTGSAWAIETVDSSGMFSVGRFTSLALDGDDYPHISYTVYDAEDDEDLSLKYARWTGSAWNIQMVDGGDVGSYASLALDGNDRPHISYQDWNNLALKYARWTGSTWDVQTVDSNGDTGFDTSIALDKSDYPHIGYNEDSSGDLRYAYWNGSTWDIQTAVNPGVDISLALDQNDRPHISCYDWLSTNLKYVYWTGSTWMTATVDSVGDVGIYSSLALDDAGYPRMSYRDSSNEHLKYARLLGNPVFLPLVLRSYP